MDAYWIVSLLFFLIPLAHSSCFVWPHLVALGTVDESLIQAVLATALSTVSIALVSVVSSGLGTETSQSGPFPRNLEDIPPVF